MQAFLQAPQNTVIAPQGDVQVWHFKMYNSKGIFT